MTDGAIIMKEAYFIGSIEGVQCILDMCDHFNIDKIAYLNNKQLFNGFTPLIAVCRMCANDNFYEIEMLEIAKLLIAAGADVNCCDDTHNRSPMYFACDNNKFDMTKLLIENGAYISCPARLDDFKNEFPDQFQKNSALDSCMIDLAIALNNDYLVPIKKEDLSLIDRLIRDPLTPIYTKQSILPELLKYHKIYPKQLSKETLLSYYSQIFFNHRFFQDDVFKDVLEFAITSNAKDTLSRSVLVSALFCCDDNQINKVISKMFEIKRDMYTNTGLFKQWIKEYHFSNSVKTFLKGLLKRKVYSNQAKAANDFIDALTVAKTMSRKKVFKLLMENSRNCDYIREAGTKKRYIPSEVASKIVSCLC